MFRGGCSGVNFVYILRLILITFSSLFTFFPFRILYELFPSAKPLVDNVEANKFMWVKLRQETQRRKLSSTNSLDFFKMPFHCEVDRLNGSGPDAIVLLEEDEDNASAADSTRI